IEEVGEVLETLEEYTPRWQAHNDDTSARTEVRRAFHTLKGSGRMVQASVLAELAWAVENMLNRVIDGNVETTPAIFAVVNAARGLMPALLDDFANGRSSDLPVVEALAGQAEMLSRGEMPSGPIGVPEPAPLSDAVVEQAPVIEPDEELQLQVEAESQLELDAEPEAGPELDGRSLTAIESELESVDLPLPE